MILCCGEALIDMLPGKTAQGEAAFVPHPGGAVFNTAIALGRLGTPAGLLSAVGQDMFGDMLVAALEESRVDRACLLRVNRPTTLAFVQLHEGQARYSFYDENSAGRMLALEEMPAIPEAAKALFFGGISLACEPGAEAYAALLARERAARVVMIDPNIRPGFIGDAARYRQRLRGMIEQADIVKISDEDLAWLYPGSGPIHEGLDTILDLGLSIVILTRGARGARARMRTGVDVEVSAQAAEVVDTVGAGDTFNAGFLAWMEANGRLSPEAVAELSEDELRSALHHASRVAAITVGRAGANPPWAHEIA